MGYVPANHQPPDLIGVMLLKTGATSEKTAVPLVHLNRHERHQLARLVKKSVVFETSTGGRYWVDDEKLRERARARTRFAIAAIVLVVILMAVAILYGS